MIRRAVKRAAAALLAHRAAATALLLVVTAALGAAASRVRLDFSVEQVFPVWDSARATYDRYQLRFPGEDARAAVVVAVADVLAPEGIARVAAIERELSALPHVRDTLSLATLPTIVPGRLGPAREPLLHPGISATERERRLALARADPLLAWNLVHPGGEAAYVLLSLEPAAARGDAGRRAFLHAARTVLARHRRDGQELVLTGIPAMRASLTELLRRDLSLVVPAAIAGVLLLVVLAFRSAAAGAAAFLAAVVSLVWTGGALGLLGWSLGLVLGLLPVLVVIVSVSDAVHVVAAFAARRRSGLAPRAAAAEALAETAVPCLVTEAVLAVGFASLAAVNVLAVVQLGVVAALAMLLTWAATMTVVPLALSVSSAPAPPPTPPAVVRALAAVTARAAWLALRRPARVLAVAGVVIVATAVLASRVEKVDHIYDDLRPGTPLERDVRAAERLYGGYIPVVVLIEAVGGESPALDPGSLALADRVAERLRRFPEVRSATSAADLLRTLHRTIAGPDAAHDPGGLPDARDVAARELEMARDARLAAAFLSTDRQALAVVARVPDVGTRRAAEIFSELDEWLASEAALASRAPGAPSITLAATGPLRLLVDVDEQLVGGVLGGLGGALLVSLAVMSIALGSWRLGLLALVPNVAPLALVLAFMTLFGIPLQAATALVFSIALVVAGDDTIQLLDRFRSRHDAARSRLPNGAAHRRALLAALREAGPPMLVSAAAVSLGFSLLLLSSLRSTAWIGLLLGATLLSAAVAELFLTPLLVAHLRPLAGWRRAARAEAEAEPGPHFRP